MIKFRVLTILVVMFLLLESSIRLGSQLLSIDDAHIKSVPDLISELAECKSPRILFIGNSLTREGVDLKELKKELDIAGLHDANIAAVFPDDTTPIHWQYIVKNHVLVQATKPDYIFMGVAGYNLVDTAPLGLRKLGCSWCKVADFPELIRDEELTFDEIGEIFTSWISWTFAKQDRIKKYILDLIIPNFRDAFRRLSDMATISNDLSASDPTYEKIIRYDQFYHSNSLEVHYLGMPIQRGWTIHPKLQQVIDEGEIKFIDMRDLPDLGETHFKDSIHLTPEGARIFSKHLAKAIVLLSLAIKPVD